MRFHNLCLNHLCRIRQPRKETNASFWGLFVEQPSLFLSNLLVSCMIYPFYPSLLYTFILFLIDFWWLSILGCLVIVKQGSLCAGSDQEGERGIPWGRPSGHLRHDRVHKALWPLSDQRECQGSERVRDPLIPFLWFLWPFADCVHFLVVLKWHDQNLA